MINDLVGLFKKAYDQYGDKMILDIYKPKEGLYIKINQEGEITDSLVIKKKDNVETDLYRWFRDRDYYSVLLEMNKPIDSNKKIHSNNCYTLFIKSEVFPEIGDDDKKLTEYDYNERVNQYFNVFLDYSQKYNNKKAQEILSLVDNCSEELINKNKKHIQENFSNIVDLAKKNEIKGYIKIFIDVDIEEYIIQSSKYTTINIFNNNDSNIKIKDLIYGLSNANMGLNAKKPYLSLKTTKFEVPFRINTNDAFNAKKLFDWLNYQDGRQFHIPYDYDFINILEKDNIEKPVYYLYLTRGISLTIEDFDYIPQYNSKIDFILYNTMQIIEKENKYIIDDRKIDELYKLENIVDEEFFNKRLKNNYYSSNSDIKISDNFTKNMQNLLIISRKAFHNFFNKCYDNDIKSLIGKISIDIVKEHMKNCEGLGFYKAKQAYNLRLSFLKYFNLRGGDMGDKIKDILDNLKYQLSSNDLCTCNNDDEFYFICGQLAYYILNQSEANKKTHGLAEPFLRINSSKDLKKKLRMIYDTYKHAIPLNYIRFNNAMSMVQGYETNSKLKDNEDMFLSGLMAKSIFYNKTTEEEQKNENE